VSIRYNTHDLVDLNGNIINLYIPGLAEGTEFESYSSETGTVTSFSYVTSLSVPSNTPAASFIYPDNVTISQENNRTIYRIGNQNLIGKTVWLQLGTIQYNHFKLIQKTPKTDTIIPEGISQLSNLLSTNVYRISLPRDFDETHQTTYYTNVSPMPTKIEQDKEGNIIATFEVPANIDSEIIIEGYVVTRSYAKDDPQKLQIPTIPYSDYTSEIAKNSELQEYTYASAYWQADNDSIQQIASELASGKNSVMEVILADYNYIVDNFDYSMEKLDSQNNRLGAVEALSGGQTVCMEYADSLTAILRAQGIAARAAFGYGNDPIIDDSNNPADSTSGETGEDSENSDETPLSQLGHQWVQIWLPDYGWLSIDPTWGESDKTYIGGDLDHILWYTVASLNDDIILYDSVMYSADPNSTTQIEGFSLDIDAVKEQVVPDLETLMTIQDIQASLNSASSTQPFISEDFDFFIKTTMFGKALIVLTPVCILIITVVSTVGITTSVIKRIRMKKIKTR